MIGSFLTPRFGLTLLKKQIEKELKKDINFFDVVYHKDNDLITFVITHLNDEIQEIKYDDTGGTLTSMIKLQVNQQLKDKNVSIDAFKLGLRPDKIISDIYYTDNEGKKMKISLNL